MTYHIRRLTFFYKDIVLPTTDGPSTSRNGSFRLAGKKMFFTWPKCDVPPQTVVNKLQNFSLLDKCLVVQEKHEDGSLHLHAAIFWSKRKDFKGLGTLKTITGQQGNYQLMRSAVDVIKYLLKSDGIKASFPDTVDWERLASLKRTRHEKFTEFATMLDNGKGLNDMWIVDNGFVAGNLRRLEEAQRWHRGRDLVHRVPLQNGTRALRGKYRLTHISTANGRSVPWMVRTLVLVGTTGVGKSWWARRSHGLSGGTHAVALGRGSAKLWWDGCAQRTNVQPN